MSGFNFNTGSPKPGGFTFGVAATTVAAAAAATTQPSLFSFSTPATGGSTTSTGNTGLSFGFINPSSSAAASSAAPAFSFNSPSTKGVATAAPFSFVTPTASTAASSQGSDMFSFLTPTASSSSTPVAGGQASTIGLTSAPAPASTGFSFTNPTSSTTMGGFSLTPKSVPAAAVTGFSLTTAQASSAANPASTVGASGFFTMPAALTPAVSTAVPGALPGFPLTTTTTASSSGLTLGFGLTTTTPAVATTTTAVASAISATATGFGGLLGAKLGAPITTAAATSSLAGPTTSAASLSTATITSSGLVSSTSGAPATSTMSIRGLEDRLNKWQVELREQEERFIRQAAHVNEWDQVLQKGHDQVQALKDTMHTVKSDQSRLEAELDFIRGQQDELEKLLEPLEKTVSGLPMGQMHQGDRHRDNMYHLALNLDNQLRQMRDDLCEVIEHLNASSLPAQSNDPMAMVARILSAHMDSLQWVEQSTSLLSKKIDTLSSAANDTKIA